MEYPVHTVEDAYDACHPEEPLLSGDPRYVDLNAARGDEDLAARISFRITNTKTPNFHRQLITGHRGCGKSTELHQLQARLRQKRFFVVYLDAEEVLDLGEIKYQDVLVAITKAIEEQLRDNGVELNPKLRQELDAWFAEHILLHEKKKDWEATFKSEFGVDAKLPLLARVLAAATGQIKAASSRREEIRRRLERELKVFIDRLNALIISARQAVQAKNYLDLVVIVDGLEKMQFRAESDGRTNHSMLFVHHAEQLKSPECHIVYTVPIFLAFNDNLRDAFSDDPFILPMVNQKSETGLDALRRMIGHRLVIEEVFEDASSVDRLIAMSGGSVRDLLRLVRSSCEGGADKIRPADVERAISRMAKELDRLLQNEDLDVLLQIAREQTITSYKSASKLLHLRLVHEYENGVRWADLHPVLREVRRVKEALAKGSLINAGKD